MTRAAIYARFSSDLQNDKSVEDQIIFCREAAAREGIDVIMTFEDRAVSGSSTVNRPGFQAMMRAAETRAFDVIFAEDIDRISRDQADYHAARKRLDYLGVAIHTATGGKISRIDGSLRALMSEMFIENLAIHIRRGLEAVVRDGRLAGGRAYGYRNVAGKPGVMEIDERDAATIREIFTQYAAGITPRAIAAELNRRGVASPRGGTWNASTINGNRQRGHGILLNRLYVGEMIWNRQRMVKDPATGRRQMRANPESAHKVASVPHMRIIEDDLWQRVQARRGVHVHRPHLARAPKRPFSGLIKCGSCGAGMAAIGGADARIQCSRFRESGSCSNGRKIKRDRVERAALDALTKELIAPDMIAEFVRTYNAERVRLAREATAATGALERRRDELSRSIERMIDALADGSVPKETVGERLRKMEAERKDVLARLATAAEPPRPIALHPAAVRQYRADVARLADLLADHAEPDAIAAVRRLVSAVIVHATPGEQDARIEIRGRISALLSDVPAPFREGESMVAREGFTRSPLAEFTLISAA